MSKLSSPDEPEHVHRTLRGPVLRKHRKRPLHPEEVHARLRERSVAEMPKTGWHWPFGWLLVLWNPDGTKRFIDIPRSATYEDAVRERDEELEFGDYDGATLIRKTYERP